MKVLLSIGECTYSQSGHFGFVTDTARRAKFVSSAIQLMEDNGLDGISVLIPLLLGMGRVLIRYFKYSMISALSFPPHGYGSLLSEMRTRPL